ncbi:MAG: glycerophosphodiester phosphodiesterase family protein [Candidatus Pseudobacter hemicellulosilyticus]|uniref:Glycerophosphodiester phosphodiesterase family protein n=1 Tax=Candidatus Pseudobacter hemicellulosilyticus TaxID=3121375 RepID=A0AAJ6BGI7_9BACT|nr:MAG: glycerophosphodiester phosphodiesterase family protein [Pseudobacter sp.]
MKKSKELIELLCIVLVVAACHAVKKTPEAMLPVFDKEGHRGCRGLMPENTIPAMLHALELGVTTLEMDAVITRDSQVILSHEPFFNHEITTKPDGSYVTEAEERQLNIFGMTYAETQRFDVGLKPHPRFPRQQRMAATKPLLGAVIEAVEAAVKAGKAQPVLYNIETKCQPATDNKYHPAPEAFIDLLMPVLVEKGITQRVIIQSFDFRTLKVLHSRYPQIHTAALIEADNKKDLAAQIEELGFTPTIFSPAYELVTPEMVEDCRARKVKLIPWTVNSKKEMDTLRAIGVDGIISDYPDLFN